MGDTAIGVAVVGRLLRRRWPAFVVFAIIGALLGLASSFVLSPGFVSTSKVLLQGDRDAKQLGGETSIATSLIVLDKVATDLGDGRTGAQLRGKVSASLDGNVITLSGAAPTPEGARRLTDRLTAEYIGFSTQIVSDAAASAADAAKKTRDIIQRRIDDANARIAQLQAAAGAGTDTPAGQAIQSELAQQRTSVSEATKDLQQLDTATSDASVNAAMSTSSASIIEPAVLPVGEGAPTLVQLTVGGAAVLVVIGAIAHLVLVRTDRRLRAARDIADALGAPVLGTIGVPVRSARASRWAAVLHDDRSWVDPDTAVVEDDRGVTARWERILTRAGSAGSWLVLVADGDVLADRVVTGLIGAVAASGPVVVLADEPDATRLRGIHPGVTVTAPDAEARPAGTIVRVLRSVARLPVVPDALTFPGPAPAVVLAVGAGTRTAWELAAVTSAAAEAGHRCVGAVLAVPVTSSTPSKRDAVAGSHGAPEMAGAS